MADPFDSPLLPAPPDWTAGSTGSSPPDAERDAKDSDPLSAWDHFWRSVGRELPETVNRTARIRSGIRRVGLR